MCNLPTGNVLQFIAKRYAGGSGSQALANLRPGQSLTMEAPFGTCTLGRRPGRKIFVAGGTGISPILAMVRQAAEERIDFEAPLQVIYGARAPEDLAAGDELAEAVARIPGAAYLPVVEVAPEGWRHGTGFVTSAISACDARPRQRGILCRRAARDGRRRQGAADASRGSDHSGSL